MAHVDMDSDWVRLATLATQKPLHGIVEDIADDMRHAVPVDTGDLHDTIHTSYPGTGKGRVHAGGESDGRLVDYWADVEYGTDPHVIRVRDKKVLYNAETGQFFGRVVNHPGTPAQPFMRPALYRHRDLA
jgi:hypothetical protein